MPNRNLALSLLVGAILLAGGCSGDSSSVPCTSAVLIDLDVSSDVEGLELVINEVLWTITGNGMAPMKGAIDTSDPNATPSIEIFGLEPGNYTIDLEATSEDGATTCRGSAMFGVTVGVVTEVAVLLRCSVGQRFGAVRVNGWFNICAELTKAVVAPLQTSIGNAIIVSSQAEDAERDPIEYAWTADNGTFANPSASATFYTCEETGNDQLTISVTDDGFEYCVDNWTVDVRCVDGGGTGGTGGTGATGGVAGWHRRYRWKRRDGWRWRHRWHRRHWRKRSDGRRWRRRWYGRYRWKRSDRRCGRRNWRHWRKRSDGRHRRYRGWHVRDYDRADRILNIVSR